ncbi:hypothetical protein KCQ_05301 [Pectobacterium atrosepticum ICMP 1526]|nr:hypothetical protein KCQ_05301 [Pectobacterium atrosepticum ICMP 1526]
MQAKLVSTLEYLWRSCAGEMATQSDLFRLTAAVETAKDKGWNYCLLNDREWINPPDINVVSDAKRIHLSRSLLDKGFDDDGQQSTPLYIGVSLDIENYCTLRLFFDLSTLAGLSRRNLPKAGIRLLFQI